jgi:transposase
MSVMSELSYDIEQLYIEGYSPKTIALQVGCTLDMVYDWIESQNLDGQEDLSPFETINS